MWVFKILGPEKSCLDGRRLRARPGSQQHHLASPPRPYHQKYPDNGDGQMQLSALRWDFAGLLAALCLLFMWRTLLDPALQPYTEKDSTADPDVAELKMGGPPRGAAVPAAPENSMSGRRENVTRYRVAICVSGQPARLQPHFLRPALLANPGLDFSLFFNLQRGQTVFNTNKNETFPPSPFARMNARQIKKNLTETFALPNVRVAGVEFHKRKLNDEWKQMLGIARPLDRIWQYTHSQGTILNMYSMQQACAAQIRSQGAFDAVIVTREDIYFFSPPDLTKLVAKLDRAGEGCDIVTKSCLAWGGLNMRFQILHPRIVTKLVEERMVFYKAMFARKKKVQNPEQFEKLQAEHLASKMCTVDVEELPVVAARYVPVGDFCFISFEVGEEGSKERCAPRDSAKLVVEKGCGLAKERMGWEKARRTSNSTMGFS